jgi:hypothetical protein
MIKKTPAGKGGEEPAGEKEENVRTKCQLVSAEACSSNLPEVVICLLYSEMRAKNKKIILFMHFQHVNKRTKKKIVAGLPLSGNSMGKKYTPQNLTA